MSATSPAAPGRRGPDPELTAEASTDVWRRFLELVLGIAGAIALFLGVFVQFAGEDQSIGFFGLWSTRVRDVSESWKFALLTGGSLLLGLSFALATVRRSREAATAPVVTKIYGTLAALGLAAALVFAALWAL